MNESDLAPYVKTALALQGFGDLPAGAVDDITVQFARIHAIAAAFAELELPPELESAAVFRP
ncbi:AtzG-like protein [Pigmentiphaga soli]